MLGPGWAGCVRERAKPGQGGCEPARPVRREQAELLSWLGRLRFLIFLFPFLIPYLFIPPLYLLPKAPKLVYMCCQHVQLLVGSSRGYLWVSGVHVKGWHRWALIDKEGRLTL